MRSTAAISFTTVKQRKLSDWDYPVAVTLAVQEVSEAQSLHLAGLQTKKFTAMVDTRCTWCTLFPVAVEGNKSKPFTHASVPLWDLPPDAAVSGFFVTDHQDARSQRG